MIILQKSVISRATLLGAVPICAALLLSGFISFRYNVLLKDYRVSVEHTFRVLSTKLTWRRW
jgi:hexokinase